MNGYDNDLVEILNRFIKNDINSIGSLNKKLRELVTISALCVYPNEDLIIKHVKNALDVGCSALEIKEAIYQCAPFIGFSRVFNVLEFVNKVFIEEGITMPIENENKIEYENRYIEGLKIQKPIYGDEIKDKYTWLPKPFDDSIPRFLTEFGFGDFSTRGILSEKDRELLIVVLLASMGGCELQVKSHVFGALKTGNSKEEIVCALVCAMPIIGIPRLFNALNCSKEYLSEL